MKQIKYMIYIQKQFCGLVENLLSRMLTFTVFWISQVDSLGDGKLCKIVEDSLKGKQAEQSACEIGSLGQSSVYQLIPSGADLDYFEIQVKRKEQNKVTV